MTVFVLLPFSPRAKRNSAPRVPVSPTCGRRASGAARALMSAAAALLTLGMTSAYARQPGGAEDPLVTLTYLNGTYRSEIVADGRAEIEKAMADAFQTLSLDGGAAYSFAGTFTELALKPRGVVKLITGSSFILTNGAASLSITQGGVINVSTGNVVSSGSMLVINQRYMCVDEGAEAVITASTDASGQVDGYYMTDGVAVTKHGVFSDVRNSDWFYDAVDYAYKNKLLNGTAADAFSPNGSMTRGMFVTALYRLDGTPPVTDAGEFSDAADPLQYYYGAVSWANGNGIVMGYGDGRFLPSESITREQMAVIMYRYALYKGIDADAVGGEEALGAFSDGGDVSEYAVPAVRWASALGIVNGSDGMLLPGRTATRAQVAQIILNFCEKIITQDVEVRNDGTANPDTEAAPPL
ncbi:MAG: S-layer homology domain-containing protein [Oscillospiraceae bacterium]|nr:S-layer homology domain-containing protein [Oscillospiraceae bacterium]